MPLLFERGEGWEYSCGIDWAGQVVERLNGGARLGDYMQTHIWASLGMKMTTFRILERPDVRSHLCSMTLKTVDGLIPIPAVRTEYDAANKPQMIRKTEKNKKAKTQMASRYRNPKQSFQPLPSPRSFQPSPYLIYRNHHNQSSNNTSPKSQHPNV